MNVLDNRINEKVAVHDRGCPKLPCYGPLLMAYIGCCYEVWKCGGWDGNEEPCEQKNIKPKEYSVNAWKNWRTG
jgi:hypothetical protein